MQKPCDSHVHFYTQEDLTGHAGSLPYALPAPHPLKAYLDGLRAQHITPAIINNVHISILPDSSNVFASFAELDALQDESPALYGEIVLVGTVLAKPAYATAERLAHPQVKGLRIVLHDTAANAIAEDAFCSANWQQMYARMRPDQHVHIYAKSAASNLKALRQIPKNIAVAIDHLGSCYADLGADEKAYQSLLLEAKQRGNVWFKGPGYRTDVNAQIAAFFAAQIVRVVGADKLLLEASDAPHVGADPQDVPFAQYFDAPSVFAYTRAVAEHTASLTGCDVEMILHGNLKTVLKIT